MKLELGSCHLAPQRSANKSKFFVQSTVEHTVDLDIGRVEAHARTWRPGYLPAEIQGQKFTACVVGERRETMLVWTMEEDIRSELKERSRLTANILICLLGDAVILASWLLVAWGIEALTAFVRARGVSEPQTNILKAASSWGLLIMSLVYAAADFASVCLERSAYLKRKARSLE